MGFLTESSAFESGVYQLETTDPVIGGANGIANTQAKQLANRTKWLNDNKQAKDATLTAIAAIVTAADKLIYATGADTFATTTLTAFARTLLDDVDAAAMRTTLDVFNKSEVGSAISTAVSALVASSPAALDTLTELATALGNDANFATTMTNALAGKQASDTTLTAIAALTTAADKLIYATGVDTFNTTTLTAFARTLLDDADAATMRSTLGIIDGIGVSQSWQDVKASRASGVTYTNTSGKAITVYIQTHGAGILYINSALVCEFNMSSTTPYGYLTAVVPNGATYSATIPYGIDYWKELR